MKKILLTALICLAAGFATSWLFFNTGKIVPQQGQQRKILYYQDPMNPEMTSPTPKKTADGMDYVPVYARDDEASGQRKIAYYQDPMHPWYTSDKPGKAPDCGMDLVPVYEDDKNIQGIHIDPNMVQSIGVKTELVARRKLTRTIRTSGIVEFDETRLFNINTKFMGWVEKLHVDYTGQAVRKGEPLLDIYSPDLVSTQEEYLQALRYRERMRKSALDAASQGGDELVQSTRRRLEFWDITDQEISALEKRGTPMRALTIYSSADGIVTEKMVIAGQQVMPGMPLYKIADLSTVWVTADIYQFELQWIRRGQETELELSYLPEKILKGTITYIYPYMETATRTAKVRLEVRNTSDFDLKPGMFATVKIASPVAIDDIAIPEQAVLRSGERDVVIVALGGGYFDPRKVRLGMSADDYVQILEGVHEGETIVTSAQFLIDSESNLKAAIGQMGRPAQTDAAGSGAPPNQPMENTQGGIIQTPPGTNKQKADDFFKDFDTTPAKENPPSHDMKNM